MHKETDQPIAKLIEMLKGIHVGMLITREKNAEDLSGRPMGINTIDADGTMWFFTKTSSLKVAELEANPRISIAIMSESSNTYLMIDGLATLVYDKTKTEALWSPMMKVWFPKGISDPDIVLISVVPKEVNYWDGSSSKMVVLFNMLKAVVTGTEYAEGEQGTIKL